MKLSFWQKCWCSVFQKSRAHKNAHLVVGFSKAHMGCGLFLNCSLSSSFSMGVVVWGSCCRRFFLGGHSVTVIFALSSPLYSWTQIPVVTGVIGRPPQVCRIAALGTIGSIGCALWAPLMLHSIGICLVGGPTARLVLLDCCSIAVERPNIDVRLE